jgi:hypothetical protein
MHQRIRIALATSAVAALTGGLLTAAAAAPASADTAAATGSHVYGDFNGDGIRDVAFSAGDAYVSGHKGAGQIIVMYGSKSGLSASQHQTISQNSTGIPGTAEAGDGFGWVSAIGDFNGDGYSDLAVSAPNEKVGSDVNGGTVAVLWGSAKGLTRGTTLADPNPSGHDLWGKALASGDFDGSGITQLAVASSSSSVYVFKGISSSTGKATSDYTVKTPLQSGGSAGVLDLTTGDVNGDHKADLVVDGYENDSDEGYNANYYYPGSASGLTAATGQKIQRGVITAIGDVNGDGYGDMVTGESWDATSGVPGSVKGGKVQVVYGTASGPGDLTSITQESGAIPGSSETGDAFGYELSLGDINGDGFQDLAIGTPGEDIGDATDTGSVTVLYGSASGIDTSAGVQYFTQDTAGVPGSNEDGDEFGSELQLADTTGDGKADLAIDAMGENDGNGAVTSLLSSGTAITTTGATSFSCTSLGVSTTGQPLLGANFAS